ncbi:vitamin B6 photo-protection and homoeostasis-domain-containing protein [Colletotrichum navitas]|uniref:Vitamin B6 photo-protection and homoeostasis-domain-containing protein n=1 Tax=Colletotrichum navitas TaxID=681940 RepID=A0AAD8VBG5_9PEZI|nr:vitamin B6 photo-protection and homoeostasis-domain-containing protein [Colletotrichum navitas]KAK1598956.1 vitamin B6 photo-protection and homoeostasis-domain-containing protein [Colletotrichum navitas]
MDTSTRSTQILESSAITNKSNSLAVAEYDKAGNLKAKYVESIPITGHPRVDVLLPVRRKKIWLQLLEIFLPDGYPHSVSDDYATYQIYDSVQAFAGSIAGMISSRAVWEGLGVGDSLASPTGAMLIQVIRESTGRFATITFAHLFGTSIEAECKAYRLASDVLCDVAMLLDCLSPFFPRSTRFLVLCFSSLLYSASGVAGNASKSSLSGHFAKWNNLGELNAKDASQETAISLMGMIAGTFVVSLLTGPKATWVALIFLLSLHLFLNWKGVRAVKSRSLNRQRANIAFSALFSRDQVLTPVLVSERELIFEKRGGSVFRWNSGKVLGHCEFGVSLREILQSLASGQERMKTFHLSTLELANLLSLYNEEEYALWCETSETVYCDAASRVKVMVVLKDGVTPKSQLKAWFHGLLLTRRLSGQEESELLRAGMDQQVMLSHIQESLRVANEKFEEYMERLSFAGWNLQLSLLETRSGSRITLETD